MMKTTHIIILLTSILIIGSCNKDIEIGHSETSCSMVVEQGCIPIPPYKGPGWGFKYVGSDSFLYDMPCLNPNNKLEFVFWLSSQLYSGIYKYNLETKIRTKLTEATTKNGTPQSQPRWGRNGWIIFDDIDQNIYKIKANGDSLIRLTNTKRDFKPEWNYDGSMFCTEYWSKSNLYYTMFYDFQGNKIDSVQINGEDIFQNQPDWQHEQYIMGTQDKKIILYDYYKKIITEINTGDLGITFPKWKSRNEIMWTSVDGIYTMNITTQQIKKLRSTSNCKQYYYLNILDNKQMLCSGITQILIDSSLEIIASKTHIYLLNECDAVTTELNLR